jgi:hypothetical protein
MTSTIEKQIEQALSLLAETNLAFTVMIQTQSGTVNYFSNSKGDKLFIVGQEED